MTSTSPYPSANAPPVSAKTITDRRKEIAILCGILIVALVVRIWLIQNRWVGPDEGAHLMDGKLLLEGFIPDVDFVARQVLYVHLTGFAVWVLGTDLFQLRYFPVAIILLSGWVVHLIGRRLFGTRAGLLAAGLFLLLPFSPMMTVQTKTEPLAILGAAGAVYWLVRSRSASAHRLWFLFLSGACAGAAFYIRQSTIALLAALLLALAVQQRDRWTDVLRSSAVLVLGTAAVTVVVCLYYLRFLPITEILSGTPSNPLSFVFANLRGAMGSVAGAAAVAADGFDRSDRLSLATSLENLSVAVRCSLVLGVGAGLSLVLARVGPATGRVRETISRYAIPVLWVAFVALAYGFWTVKRGFFPAYFLEGMAPLALLTAAAVDRCWRLLPGEEWWRAHLSPLLLLAVLFGVVHLLAGSWQINRPLYFVVTAVVLGAFYLRVATGGTESGNRRLWAQALAGIAALAGAAVLVGPELPGRWSALLYLVVLVGVLGLLLRIGKESWRPWRPRGVAFAGYSVIVSSLFLSLSASGLLLDLSYHSVWSPRTVQRVSEVLGTHSDPGDTVVSGAVIWELQADRPPFGNVSHPLAFPAGSLEDRKEELRRELRASPPSIVILDGYTEKTYYTGLPELREVLQDHYRSVATVGGSRYPVAIYRRMPDATVRHVRSGP